MFDSLQKTVAADDMKAASPFVLHPLRVNGGKEPITIEDKDDFKDKYNLIFIGAIGAVKKALADQKPRDMTVNCKGVMAGNGGNPVRRLGGRQAAIRHDCGEPERLTSTGSSRMEPKTNACPEPTSLRASVFSTTA